MSLLRWLFSGSLMLRFEVFESVGVQIVQRQA